MFVDVLIKVKNEKVRFEPLQSFSSVANAAWSKSGQIFPMYSSSGKIYECGFNSREGLIVAFAVVEMSEFRKKLSEAAEKLYSQRMEEAAFKAAQEVAAIYAEAFRPLSGS